MVQKNAQTKAPAAAESALGYPLIEKLLDTEDFNGVNKTFAEAYDKLEKMMNDRSGGLKKQKDAEAAMKAYEHTVELIKELLRIKQELAANTKSEGAKK